jgi:hypothetical protein
MSLSLEAMARAMRADGLSYREIGAGLGISESKVRRILDPRLAERAGERDRRRQRDAVARPSLQVVERAAELRARKREIPEDTRSLTALLCGDPLPNDRRRQA